MRMIKQRFFFRIMKRRFWGENFVKRNLSESFGERMFLWELEHPLL